MSIPNIRAQLLPLERALKQCCYINKRARIALVIAQKFVNDGRPVIARWFELIEESRRWVENQPPLKYRFDALLFGDGIKMFFRYPIPEKRLWLYLEYIRQNMNKMVDLESTRKWMRFDDDSRGTLLVSVEDWVIGTHAERHDR